MAGNSGSGRKAQPAAFKELMGTNRPDMLVSNIIPAGNMEEKPVPPDKLGEFGRLAWNFIVERLVNNNALDYVDLVLLESLCLNIDMVRKHEKELVKLDFPTDREGLDLLKAYNMALQNVRSLGSEFGLSPAQRSKLIFPKKETKNIIDPLDKKRE